MNKKLLVVSILAVLMLIAISFATAVTSNTNTTTKKRESPLFGIRTKLAIGQKLQDLTTRFIRQRVFFLPFQWLRNRFSAADWTDTPGYNSCFQTCPGIPGCIIFTLKGKCEG